MRHGSKSFPKQADFVALDGTYSDVFEEEYFRRKGHPVKLKNDFVGKPHWVGLKREDDSMVLSRGGQEKTAVNALTGEVTDLVGNKANRRKRVGRNDPCPCGSGLKFKKCCIRRSNYTR